MELTNTAIFSYLFYKFNTSLQIESKIDKNPINPFPFVFFLFQNEHMVVEKLLQFFVGEIDAELLEAVEL